MMREDLRSRRSGGGRSVLLGTDATQRTIRPAGREKAFTEARVLIAQAKAHREAGEAAGKAGNGVQDAIPHYQEAKPLYREAFQIVEEWIEPELGVVTEGQVEEFMQPELAELHRWQKASASMGKVPPKE